jgi:hypothetical protein
MENIDLMVLTILYPILKIHLFLKTHGLNRGLCVGRFQRDKCGG